MSGIEKTFLGALNRQLWIWRGGTLLCSLFRVLRLTVLVLLAAVLADYFLALSPLTLMAVDLAAVGGLGFVLLWELIGGLALSRKETAERIDQLLGNRRQPVLTAYELQATSPTEGWGQFLVERSLREGEAALAGMSPRKTFPWPAFWRQFRLSLLAAVPFAALLLWQPQATQVVLARLLHPNRDLPPYSTYHFRVSPQPAQVVYGGSVELTVQITGGPVRHPVVLQTRKGEYEDQSICFRQGEAAFTQRLEKVVDPVEFCFVVGRARSAWHSVEILLQPKVEMLKLAVEPPAYTGLAPTEAVMSQEIIEGYKGSKARLQLTSNRPLSRGVLTLVPLSGIDESQAVVGRKSGLHTVAFEWELKYPARVEVRVEDVQGTSLAEPLQLTQKIIPDRPPDVAINSPAPYALATPSVTVSVQGVASDDLALRGVTLVRTIAGYRDRTLPLGPPVAEKQFSVACDLNLGQIGVVPGQVIELFLEARDFNPERIGVGSSEIVRLEIISDAEYAEMIRASETLEQFAARYRTVEETFEAFRRTVADLLQESQKPQPDKDRINELLDQARNQNRQARKLFRQLASEFQAYKLEEGWKQALDNIARRFEGHHKLLEEMNADSPRLPGALDRLKKDLELDAQQMAPQKQLTEGFLKAGRVMEQAAQFMQILNRQRDLTRLLQRRQSDASDQTSLRDQGNREAEIRQDLIDFPANLEKAAEALSADKEFDELWASSMEFAGRLKGCGADALMQQAVDAARNDNGPDTLRNAQLAKEKLEELLSQCENSPFGGLCRGNMKFNVKEELRDSLADLLASLMSSSHDRKNGRQGDGAAPGGGVGSASDGYSVASHTRLNTPVLGPARSQFLPGGMARGSEGQSGPGGAEVVRSEKAEPAAGQAGKDLSGSARASDLVPEKYRQALKRYFSPAETRP